ncbi:hypothetical protein [Nostoc sp. CHAB 5836]|nr:hypothetical protein [Nostoc sp. CHAB 5836]
MLRKVNTPETFTNDKGQMTNDSFHQLALFTPTYLDVRPNCVFH